MVKADEWIVDREEYDELLKQFESLMTSALIFQPLMGNHPAVAWYYRVIRGEQNYRPLPSYG